ncbi:hypothetical protein HKD37_02G004129 [Glycine soja]
MHYEAEALEHMKKIDTGHQSVSLENKTGDSTVLKIGDSAKVVIKQDMKGRRHKYGFNNNKREKPEKVRVVDDETGDKHQLDEVLRMPSTCIMGSPPASPPPPPPPPHSDASASPSAVKRTCKASRLRSLSTRPPGAERPVVHVDPATGKANGPHRKKLRTYLRNLISQRLLTVGRKGSYFRPWGRDGDTLNQTSRGNGPLQSIRTVSRTLSVRNTTSTRKSGPSFARLAETLLGRYNLLAEKTKKKLEEAAQSGSIDGVIDPPSPIRRHVKWKMARTKKTWEMTTKAAKEIAEKIDSFEEQATQGSFLPQGRQDVVAAAIGRPEHPGRVRATGAGVTIKQYFGSAPRMSRSSSSLPPEEL